MQVLLVSTYDLGRQPFGLASPAAWLRREAIDASCIDVTRTSLQDEDILRADLVAFYLPMHTATRLAMPLIARVKRLNPAARIATYGLYAQLNEAWLREHGVDHVLGPEAEPGLVALARAESPEPATERLARLDFIHPDRSGLPLLSSYAGLHMPDGTRRIVGSTDATRGCKHLCRHCPIVPVYRGQFRAIPVDVVMVDVAAQVKAGAEHISFGDPDFLNGPSHARRIVDRLAREHPGITYDVTIKVEHLLKHCNLLPVLRDTGCVFVTTAVESVDDEVLAKLAKGHTRADFVRVVDLCRTAGIVLSPTFVPFTPWTTIEGYIDLLETLESLELVEHVAPIQLAIRLLVTAGSLLLETPDIAARVQPFDGASLTWPWRHDDSRVDRLQEDVMGVVGVTIAGSRASTFAAVMVLARNAAGWSPRASSRPARSRATVPYLNEPWYC